MRKSLMFGLMTVIVLGAAVPVAVAAIAQVNTYSVTGTFRGTKGATKKAPVPVAVKFSFGTGEASGLRPSPVNKYVIQFGGLRVNTAAFKGCDPDRLNDPGGRGLSECPAGSIIGAGHVINEVGPSEDPSQKSLVCYLALTTINSTKKNHFLLYLKGGPSDSPDPRKQCVAEVHQAIDAKFKQGSGGVSLSFTVPTNLLHLGGVGVLDNAVTEVATSLKKVTAQQKGKAVGYFESTGCTSKTAIAVTFTQESNGSTKSASKTGVCG